MSKPRQDSVPPSARSVAARVLGRVHNDQAFAAAALDAELSRYAQLDARERGLATELVYGVLRCEGALDARISRHAPKGIKDRETRLHLLVAAYQLLLLDRVPAFAAVDAAVSLVRKQRGDRVAAFANAVLRKLAASGERLALDAALRESAQPWLWQRLVESVGEDEALALLGGGDIAPTVGVRLVAGREAPAWAREASTGRVSPRARRIERRGDPKQLEGYADGSFVVQEEGAQAVALLLGARPGERVLDACAGRGQKASLLAEQVGASGEVFATDVHPPKLDALQSEFRRLRLPAPRVAAVDWSAGVGDVAEGFDRVLVDAPCTGTGTLRHRPEIARRLSAEDPARLGALAESILRSASTRARPGGRVVFAVCSVLTAEGEAVVERVRDVLEPVAFDDSEVPGLVPNGATYLRLLPHAHGTDGYFVASFVRR
ncbi:MAG TPA: transcription antitermination factor NusB [Polyangiaceae bacterium]|nr:transcription antitermination factor NusB [Polyangiaceae bacterium]